MYAIIKVFCQACRLDIFDLNYFVSNESCGYLNRCSEVLPRKGYFLRAAVYIFHFLQEIKFSFWAKKVPEKSILFFAASKNQRDALANVAELTNGAVIAGKKCELQYYFPLFWAYLIGVFFLPCLVRSYVSAGAYQRKAFRYLLDIYLLTFGYYVVGYFWLKRAEPRCFVVANDHVMQTRTMIRLAQDLRVVTVYIQHASVTEKFPPLSFDYALLEGVDALRKYERKGPTHTRVFLVGMPKADAFVNAVNQNAAVRRVGICCNRFDAGEDVKSLCARLVKQFPTVKFTLRPHPGDIRRFAWWKRMAADIGMAYSDPHAEWALEFLGTVDAMIAGESSIHLEAALLDVYPLYFVFSSGMVDWYGFHKNGVTEYFPDSESLCEKIVALQVEKPSVRHRCKHYCHTVCTTYDWKSSVLTKDLIESIACGNPSNCCIWEPYQGTELEVFQPR